MRVVRLELSEAERGAVKKFHLKKRPRLARASGNDFTLAEGYTAFEVSEEQDAWTIRERRHGWFKKGLTSHLISREASSKSQRDLENLITPTRKSVLSNWFTLMKPGLHRSHRTARLG